MTEIAICDTLFLRLGGLYQLIDNASWIEKKTPVMAISTKLATKIANAKTSRGGNRIKDGIYLWEVQKLCFDDLQGGPTFVAELLCLDSESNGMRSLPESGPAGIGDGSAGEIVEPNKPGSTASFVCALNSTESAAGNMKEFLLEMTGAPEGEFSSVFEKNVEHTDDESDKRLNENQPAKGTLIACETYRKKTKNGKNAGKWGCYPRWKFVSPEEAKALRAEMEAAKK